jgi:hypothetical protein
LGGYGELLWGKRDHGRFQYGYIRPGARIATSAVTHRAEVILDLYPISFFGFRFAHQQALRGSDIDTINCAAVSCRSWLGSTSVKAQAAAGYGPVFAVATLRYAIFEPAVEDRPFADEVSALVGEQGGDNLASIEGVLGYSLDVTKSLGLYYLGERMLGTGNTNNQQSLFGRWKNGEWTYTLGAGMYESVTQPRGFTAYGIVQWSPLSGVALN